METVIYPPSSKSVTHRALICAALADGVSELRNVSYSEDIKATISCLRAVGTHITENENDESTVTVETPLPRMLHFEYRILNKRVPPNIKAALYCNESGSTLRFLIPVVSVLGIPAEFIGEQNLMRRPLKPITDLLNEKGGKVRLGDGTLSVSGKIESGTFEIGGDISSQYVTGLMLALPIVGGGKIVMTTPLQSRSYVDLTMSVMRDFGITVKNNNYESFDVNGGSYTSHTFLSETDYSGAAFFLVASAIHKPLSVMGLNPHSLQGDRRILDILKQCGADVIERDGGIVINGSNRRLKPLTVDVSDIPDLVPILAVLMCFCDGESRIVNAGRLRYKESDRLMAITKELSAIGADITEHEDSLKINGRDRLCGGVCSSHNDHRIAMAVAIASLRCDGEVTLDGKECVYKSYPKFWEDFEKVGGAVNECLR
jgi:3-phosphoshikimate 1-carboxyvinyltransferase